MHSVAVQPSGMLSGLRSRAGDVISCKGNHADFKSLCGSMLFCNVCMLICNVHRILDCLIVNSYGGWASLPEVITQLKFAKFALHVGCISTLSAGRISVGSDNLQ